MVVGVDVEPPEQVFLPRRQRAGLPRRRCRTSVMRQSIFRSSSVADEAGEAARRRPGSSKSRRNADLRHREVMADEELDRLARRRSGSCEAGEHRSARGARSRRRDPRRATCRRRDRAAPASSSSGAWTSVRIDAEPRAARARRMPAEIELANRQERVLVDGVLVVEVANHAAVDALELGKDRAEQAAVEHLRQPRRQARPRHEQAAQLLASRLGAPTK